MPEVMHSYINSQTVVISCSLDLNTSKHMLQMPTKEKPDFRGTEY
jgi:hypothetical protein